MIYPDENYKHLYLKIIKSNKKREKKILSEYATFSKTAIRRKEESTPDKLNIRPAYFHDTDRILHCLSYSRYNGKTQVFPQPENDHITRRILHVQLVSKIARTLGRFFNANEDLIEAISLAHDIGHAPLGHAGEEVIAKILQTNNKGNFLHHAQSVRILDYLEDNGRGLNLTLQVLDGVLGHNGELLTQHIKFFPENLNYNTLDNNLLNCFKLTSPYDNLKKISPSTLEGAIVRISDIIAYIGRDIDDALLRGLINVKMLPQEAACFIGNDNRHIINNLIMDIVHNTDLSKNALSFSELGFGAMNSLLQFNYNNIYKHPELLKELEKNKQIIKIMFEKYLNDIMSNTNSDIWDEFINKMPKTYLEENNEYRIVADYISGMTDNFLKINYNKYDSNN